MHTTVEQEQSYEMETQPVLELLQGPAQAFMQPPLEYHNWDMHVLSSFDYAAEQCDRYEATGNIPVDRLMIGSAILFHDAGIAHDLPSRFDNDEAYSADIAGLVLSGYGFERGFIEGVKQCIRATHVDSEPATPEEKLTCRADLANTFGVYPGFVLNFFRVFKEARLQKNENLSFTDFRSGSIKMLRKYLSKDLVIDETVDCDSLGEPFYRVLGTKNIDRLERASSKQMEATLRPLGDMALDILAFTPSSTKRELRGPMFDLNPSAETSTDQAAS